MGRWFPISPGGTNFRLKALTGVSVRNYTSTQVVNLEAKRCNYYTTFGGNPNVCGQGQMAGGQFMDVTRDIDQMVAWVSQDLASLLSQVEKLPYTEEGADLIEATIRAVNDRGIKAGIVNGGEEGVPAPVVTVPKPAEQSPANRQLRKFVGITDVFRLDDAVNFIEVTLSIST